MPYIPLPLLKKLRQKRIEVHYITAVCLISVIINNDIPLADRFLDLQHLDMLILNTAPGEFRPEADPHIGRDHILNGRRIVTLEDDLGREAGMLAEPVADIAELPGTKEAYEPLLLHLGKADRRPVPVSRVLRYCQIDLLRTREAVLPPGRIISSSLLCHRVHSPNSAVTGN